jgi:hypothetical protein
MPDSTAPCNVEMQGTQSCAVERIIARGSDLRADEPDPADGKAEPGGQ